MSGVPPILGNLHSSVPVIVELGLGPDGAIAVLVSLREKGQWIGAPSYWMPNPLGRAKQPTINKQYGDFLEWGYPT